MMKKYIYYIILILFGAISGEVNAGSIKPFVDALLWKAGETNTSWATTLSFPGNYTYVVQSNPTFNTRVGTRAGLLYEPDNNFWNTKFYWTYFPTSSTKTIPISNHIVTSLFFSGSYFISGDIFFGGNANWDLVMNMLDLEISHAFHPIPALSLSPKIGIKGGSINQDISITWNALLYNSTENLSNHFTGIGPSFGLEGKWNLYQQWSLVGDISTALMYGRWNDTDVYHRPAAILITPQTISTSSTQSRFSAMMVDYYAGIEWLHRGRSNVTLQLGYEMQYWPNQLRLTAVQQLPTLGDLTIQGATCGISIDL